ncbi:MAG: hypothetical protein Q7K48_04510 [Fusobacterium sp. JB021]|nr:hypothetical protein [Fusobacterium sp. JB021]MDP0506129.1 hypothetical protein [Fusobacterium sp. JB019]
MGLFDGLFKEKSSTVNNDKELKEITNLNNIIVDKDLKIEKLEGELTTLKNETLSPKQVHIMEKNLKSSRETNSTLEQEVIRLKKEIEKLESEISNSNVSFDNIYKNLINNKFIYKLGIDNFFKTVKFEEVRNFLTNNNILFIQDLESFPALEDILKIKNGRLALKKYEKLKKGIVPWDLRIFLCKGEKIQKIYKNKRKFITYLNEHNIEFMDDMNDFDFESLIVKGGFPKKAVEEFKILTDNYFNEFKL